MKSQRYKFYSCTLYLLILIVLIAGCGSLQSVKTNSATSVRDTIATFINAMNNKDIKTLEFLYSDDFLSYEPKFNLPKKQLLNSIQKGFDQHNYRIEAKIIEIIGGSSVTSAHLKWKIIGEDKEVIYDNDLLQIWVNKKENWKLSRILFFAGNEVPKIEDLRF